MKRLLLALCLVLPHGAAAQPSDLGAALAFPFLAFPGFATAITVTHHGTEQRALRVAVIDGTPGGVAASADFPCPVIPGQTATIWIRSGPGAQIEAECSDVGATSASPPAELSRTVTRFLPSFHGLVWVSLEDPVTGQSLGRDEIRGTSNLVIFASGRLISFPAIPFAAGAANDGNRTYLFDGNEYQRHGEDQESLFMFESALTTSLVGGTLDLSTFEGFPTGQMNIDFYDQFETNFNAFFIYEGVAIVTLGDITANLLASFNPGSFGGWMSIRRPAAPVAASGSHDTIPGVGNSDGQRRSPLLVWKIKSIPTGATIGPDAPPAPTPVTSPGGGATGAPFRPSGPLFTPNTGDVPALRLRSADGDGDGVADPISDGFNRFSDLALGGSTLGEILDPGDQSLQITDAAQPLGVHVEAPGNPGPAPATLSLCTSPSVLEVSVGPGGRVLGTCGSAFLRAVLDTARARFELGAWPVEARLDAPNAFQLDGDGALLSTDAKNRDRVRFRVGGTPVKLPADATLDPNLLEVDVAPFDSRNRIQRWRPITAVALLSNTEFDAAGVPARTLRFGPKGTRPAGALGHPFRLRLDVNQDGRKDLVVFFPTRRSGFPSGDGVLACVTGSASAQRTAYFAGCEQVSVP